MVASALITGTDVRYRQILFCSLPAEALGVFGIYVRAVEYSIHQCCRLQLLLSLHYRLQILLSGLVDNCVTRLIEFIGASGIQGITGS
jgi:hypothetical protein